MKVYLTVAKIVCILLVISTALYALPIYASESPDGSPVKDARVVTVVNSLGRGRRITKEDVRLESVGKAQIPANALTSLDGVIGSYATEELHSGEYLQAGQISDEAMAAADPELLIKPILKSNEDYVIVTDYVVPNTDEDISYFLQQIIDKNPNRTIYFPDGVYTIAYPLIMPSKVNESVALRFADGAVLKAHANWKGKVRGDGNDALIRIGADGSNTDDFKSMGHYYNVMGGTFDGGSRANGINVECGLEVVIRDVRMINVRVGLLVKDGVHSRSSCVDAENITVIGNGVTGEVGVKVVGLDNTFSNIRVYDMPIGFQSANSGGNFISGIYVYDTSDALKNRNTVGIVSYGTDWISDCYVENADVAYELGDKVIFRDNTASWSKGFCKLQQAFIVNNGAIALSGCRAIFDPVADGRYVYQSQGMHTDAAIFNSDIKAEGVEGIKVIPIQN